MSNSSAHSKPLMSMTGFGRGSSQDSRVMVEVEIKSVNNRFLDVSFKLPRFYQAFEPRIKALIQERFGRGRLEFQILRMPTCKDSYQVVVNRALFENMLESGNALLKDFSLLNEAAKQALFFEIFRSKDVISVIENIDQIEKEWSVVETAVNQALLNLKQMREQEGSSLSADLHKRLKNVSGLCEQIKVTGDRSPESLRAKLEKKIKGLSKEVLNDPARLYLEVGIMAERLDIAEELSRLSAHIVHFSHILEGTSEAASDRSRGRHLDFLLQEFNRELNTIGAKAQDAEIQAIVVLGKVEVERLREQVQNVE